MSRRRMPRRAENANHVQVQLVCTDRGRHKLTHLGSITVIQGELNHEWAIDEDDPDFIRFHPGRSGSRMERLVRSEAAVESVDDTDPEYPGEVFVYAGERGLEPDRRHRFKPSRLCSRCDSKVTLREDRLIPIVRAAAEQGLSRLDVSQLG